MLFRFFCLFIFCSLTAASQRDPAATDRLLVTGRVKQPQEITLSVLDSLPKVTVGDVRIINYKGEVKRTYTGVKGVRLKDIVDRAGIDEASPKLLSEYYLAARALDGYTVIISWNEMFNTPAGDGFIIVTEADGKLAAAMDERLLMLAVKDIHTGRRHVKALQTLEVKRN